MIDRLLKLEEQGWAALSSAEPVQFCDEWLADEAAMVVPGMVIDRATSLEAVRMSSRGRAIASRSPGSYS
jgi:hypothetical protein